MKPTFALDLTRDVVGLLHRTPKGWLSVGEVAFDAPDLDEALDYLRKTALGLSPLGLATKIVLPNSQILYTEVTAPGPSRDEKRRQIATALEGRTPYDVADLVFDWSGKGATVKVAVVARETLDEAEAFAVQHKLNPVGFVAIPEGDEFVGEPFFGPTAAATTLLAEGETVEKDREPVSILQRELPAAAPLAAPRDADPVTEAVEPAPEPASVEPAQPTAAERSAADLSTPEAAAVAPEPDTPAPAPPPAHVQPDDDPLPGLEEALNADLPEPEPTPIASAPSATAPVALAPSASAPAAEPPAPEEDLADDLPGGLLFTQTGQPAAKTVDSRQSDEADEAPFAHVPDSQAEDEGPAPIDPAPAAPPRVGPKTSVTATELDDDIPPAPPSAAMVAFASRRATAGAAPAVPAPSTARPDASGAAKLGSATPAPVRPAPAKTVQGLVTAPSIPGTRGKPKAKPGAEIPRPIGPGPTTVRSPARPGGTFGTAAPARGRGGMVFTILVALLLLFLALIAAWSSYYLSADDTKASATEVAAIADADPAGTSPPAVEDEMLADMQDPEGLTEPLPEAEAVADGVDLATLATETAPDPGAVNMAAEDPALIAAETAAEAEAAAAAPEPAPGTAVATDVTAAQAPAEDQDEIFLSAMDAPPPALDALALPAPIDTADAAPAPVMPPPAFGTVYRFDAKGLLVPTPEGIVSPDGVLLIAGPPPLVPPSRSEAAAALAAAAAPVVADPADEPVAAAVDPAADPAGGPAPTTAADASLVTTGATDAAETVAGAAETPVASDPALAGFRPRARPESLAVPATDDGASLDPDPAVAAEFAGKRPLPRPEVILAAAAAAAPAAAPADLGAQGASLTAQAEAELAAAAALEARNPSVVAISRRPEARPRDFSRAVEAAVAAAVRAPEPEEVAATAPAPDLKPEELDEATSDEPEVAAAAPSIPTRASVAKQATFANAINLSKINLIGTYGTDSRRYALIRQSNGRFKKVSVGDRIDGGTVKAITETEVRYQKGGRLISLKMPKA
ncbi:translation initiation factor 2 [Tabrizicola aquatica]|uniref:translation initiation factor 2 n=1 Tax=Tabrizicola aquatica TaxID=909926 RepID=UPI000CD13878|nr:translation initiation factor 2 [Tabrizicola aquatica]